MSRLRGRRHTPALSLSAAILVGSVLVPAVPSGGADLALTVDEAVEAAGQSALPVALGGARAPEAVRAADSLRRGDLEEGAAACSRLLREVAPVEDGGTAAALTRWVLREAFLARDPALAPDVARAGAFGSMEAALRSWLRELREAEKAAGRSGVPRIEPPPEAGPYAPGERAGLGRSAERVGVRDLRRQIARCEEALLRLREDARPARNSLAASLASRPELLEKMGRARAALSSSLSSHAEPHGTLGRAPVAPAASSGGGVSAAVASTGGPSPRAAPIASASSSGAGPANPAATPGDSSAGQAKGVTDPPPAP